MNLHFSRTLAYMLWLLFVINKWEHFELHMVCRFHLMRNIDPKYILSYNARSTKCLIRTLTTVCWTLKALNARVNISFICNICYVCIPIIIIRAGGTDLRWSTTSTAIVTNLAGINSHIVEKWRTNAINTISWSTYTQARVAYWLWIS